MGVLKLVLCTVPEHATEAAATKYTLCHMAYRIGAGFKLYRSALGINARGGLMMLSDYGADPSDEYSNELMREVKRECDMRGFDGVVCDFESGGNPALGRFVTAASDYLSGFGIKIYVDGGYADLAPDAGILISTGVARGVFEDSLGREIRKYGDRAALFFEPLCHEFSMTSEGDGARYLNAKQLSALIKKQNAVTYFSQELCAGYFTYRDGAGAARFVLFDDTRSLVKKAEVAASLGFAEAFMPYIEAAKAIDGLRDVCDF